MINRKKVKVLEYSCLFQEEKEGGYSVWVPALPGCTSQGETFEQTQENIKGAIRLYLEDANPDEIKEYQNENQFIVPVSVPVYA